jgi:hypothetical protein
MLQTFGTVCTAHAERRVHLRYRCNSLYDYDYIIFIYLKYKPIQFITKTQASELVSR